MAPNLFEPAFTHFIDFGMPVYHSLGSLEARHPELESFLGQGKSFNSAERIARNGLRNLSRQLLDSDEASCALL